MPEDSRFASATVDVETDAVTALLNGGSLRVYSGSRPTTADEATGGSALLVELRFGSPAFSLSAGGVALATPIANALATATGEATWVRAVRADGITVFDGSVGSSDENLVMSNTFIQRGGLVAITSFAYHSPRS